MKAARAALILGIGFFAACSPQQKQADTPRNLKISIVSTKIEASLAAYHGDGLAIARRPRPFSDGMSAVMMQKEDDGQFHGYVATRLEPAADQALLVFTIDVKNVSPGEMEEFQPLDIGLTDKDAHFAGVGEGNDEIPFTKSAEVWSKFKQAGVRRLNPGEQDHYIYAYVVAKSSASWTLTYKGAAIGAMRAK